MPDVSEFFGGDFWFTGSCLACFVLLGLLFQRKPINAVLAGLLNVVCGYFMLCIGAGFIANVTRPISQTIAAATGTKIVFASNEAAVALYFSRYTMLSVGILVVMCALNIVLARFTRYKVIFFTGHVLLFTAGMLAALQQALTNWPMWCMVLTGGVAGLCINVISMRACQRYIDLLPHHAGTVALAHTGTISVFLTGLLASKLGNREDSAEQWNISGKWSFFRDAPVASAVTMAVTLLILCSVAGRVPDASEGFFGVAGYALKGGVLFGISISLILFGVRLVTGDLVSTLKFFVDKLAPGAKLGVDAPMFFSCAQKSWLLAFLVSYPLSILFSVILAWAVGLPCVSLVCSVPCFFDAGIAGVIGNTVGGKRGVLLGAAVHALLMAVGLSLLGMLVPLAQETGFIWGGPDAAFFGTILGFLLKVAK